MNLDLQTLSVLAAIRQVTPLDVLETALVIVSDGQRTVVRITDAMFEAATATPTDQ